MKEEIIHVRATYADIIDEAKAFYRKKGGSYSPFFVKAIVEKYWVDKCRASTAKQQRIESQLRKRGLC